MSQDLGPSGRRQGAPPQIGPYRILQTLGEGGMGVVYEAEQTSPVRRRVALKVVRAGFDSKEIVARFEAERQALAVMDHPNIARVYEAGTTDDGRPYFAMELVKGTPITEYCDTQKLSTVERLHLFVSVCRAVQHAHHKGVIHRDLKPSNVLVTIADNQPVPKVIDFGIAKAMGQDLTDKTLVTELGQLIGTPDYMSPEQAEMTGLDIDTRTDVYSLGVMLYEILVGARPLDLRNVAIMALWQAIREQMPPTPSSRLATLPGDTQESIAHYRHTDPSDLRRTLQGDLDWVAMKCLEKDRTRRYETANGLALDLERFLRHEPVVARPPSAGYRFRKFVRRHRAGVAAVAVALVAVAAGSTAAVVGMVSARRSEERAVDQATLADQISTFLVGLFELAVPGGTPDGDQDKPVTVRELLDRGTERIETDLDGQPVTQAELMEIIGQVYYSLGEIREALRLFERGLELHESAQGPDHPEVAEILMEIGTTRWRLGEYGEAEDALQRSLDIREETLDPDDPDLMENLDMLARVHQARGENGEAVPLFERVLAIRQKALDPDDSNLALSFNNLAGAYVTVGRNEEALANYRKALEVYEASLGDHPYTAVAALNLGAKLRDLGRHDEAEPLLQRAREMEERLLPENHFYRLYLYAQLGRFYEDQDKLAEAEAEYRHSLQVAEASVGPTHADYALVLARLSGVVNGLGRSVEAESLAVRALSIWGAALAADHPNQAVGRVRLADALAGQGRYVEADSLYGEALALDERVLGDGDPTVAEVLEKKALALRQSGRASEADSLEARARAIRQSAEAEDDEASSN